MVSEKAGENGGHQGKDMKINAGRFEARRNACAQIDAAEATTFVC
jgi:hypothetical protein